MNLRALNRATLARQHLLERSSMSVSEVLEHLVGLQAQTANTWYTGFWSRLEDFRPNEASQLLLDRKIVRTALMRSTLHLVTAEDALRLRPLLQPAIERPMTGYWRSQLKGAPAKKVAAAGRAILEEEPLTNIKLGALLAKRWPGPSPSDLAMTVRVYAPLVQVTPRGVWGASAAAAHTTLDAWLGRPLEPGYRVEELVLRYLGAFGPATPADAQTWSGLTRLREVFERLRPKLATFRDEDGRELFDLPDAPRPDADTPAPPRFIYDYDNILRAHADRSRFIGERRRKELTAIIGAYSYGSLFVDGRGVGVWRIERSGKGSRVGGGSKDAPGGHGRSNGATAVLSIKLAERVSKQDGDEVAEEGERLLAFWAEDAKREVRFGKVS